MKFRYDIRSISGNFIKKIIKNAGYNFEKISNLEAKITKIESINDSLKRYNEAKIISKNYQILFGVILQEVMIKKVHLE